MNAYDPNPYKGYIDKYKKDESVFFLDPNYK